MNKTIKPARKPNISELNGWQGIAAAIYIEARYQNFTKTMLSQASNELERRHWIEHLGIGDESHRTQYIELLHYLDPQTR